MSNDVTEPGRGYLGQLRRIEGPCLIYLSFRPTVGQRLVFFSPFHRPRGPAVTVANAALSPKAWGCLVELSEPLPSNVAMSDQVGQDGDIGEKPIADPINHPAHYKSGGMESIDVIEAFALGFNLGNVVKYVLRAGKKGDRKQDLEKAMWYLRREIESADIQWKDPAP